MGISLRTYLRFRKLTEAAIALRDTNAGILDIALEFGFSSQEAFTRAFQEAWGVTPGAWRAAPSPLPFLLKRPACISWSEGGTMGKDSERKEEQRRKARARIDVSIQKTPPCRFVGLFIIGAKDYCDFWDKAERQGIDCRIIEGLLASLSANAQIGGWFGEGETAGYAYGVELPADWNGTVPQGMRMLDIPEMEYLVFHHPAYDYDTEDEAVWLALGDVMREYDVQAHGVKYRTDLPCWQRHDPAGIGQAWCRPIIRI
jgi:hypothetical protein